MRIIQQTLVFCLEQFPPDSLLVDILTPVVFEEIRLDDFVLERDGHEGVGGAVDVEVDLVVTVASCDSLEKGGRGSEDKYKTAYMMWSWRDPTKKKSQ